jgi:hypothetical protein
MGDAPPLSLIDVLSVPTIGEAVVQHLSRGSKSALRQSCSALCALVRHMVGRPLFLPLF